METDEHLERGEGAQGTVARIQLPVGTSHNNTAPSTKR